VRCSSITRRLLDFSRHMESSIEPVDVEAVLRQILGFIQKEVARRSIRVRLNTAGVIPMMIIDRGGLQQVFLNLINNALAALADGGELDITIARRGGEQIQVEVADNGHGIPAEDIQRVFEPFFSTRDQSAGTGLGLSVTYGLVTEMGGDIAVTSDVGRGSCFRVTLPLKQEPEAAVTAAGNIPKPTDADNRDET
jgi:signal transduction histidine kinase